MPIVIDSPYADVWDYDSLKTAILDWSARTDTAFSSRVPDFIRLAEERIWRGDPEQRIPGLRVNQMIVFGTLTIVAGQPWVALPTNWLEFDSLTIPDGGKSSRLEYISYDALQDLNESCGKYNYSTRGDRLIYGQTGSEDLVISGSWYAKCDPLAITPTNWLLSQAPSVYLYAALLEGAIYLKNPTKAGEYGALLGKALQGLYVQDQAAKVSGSRLRVRAR